MTTNKMTYVVALSYVLDNCEMPVEVKEKLEALKMQTEKRNSADAKPTKTQLEADANREHLLEVMANGETHTISEWQETDKELENMTNQKVSALMRTLVNAGKVRKDIEKRKSYFTIA